MIMIPFEGKEYPAREIFLNDEFEFVVISVESLEKVLCDAQLDVIDFVKSENAMALDDEIFFYVPDEWINNPEDGLRQFVLESI